jgi:hypothetical protein
VDNDFFAAPPPPTPPPAYAQPSAYVPVAPVQSQRRSSSGLVWVAGVVVVLAAVGAAIAGLAGGGLAKHEAKTLDRMSAAYDASIQAELMRAGMEQQAFFAANGRYGSAEEIGRSAQPSRSGAVVTITYGDAGFCLKGSHPETENVFYYSSGEGLLPLGQTCS